MRTRVTQAAPRTLARWLCDLLAAPSSPSLGGGGGVISDIVLSPRTFFLPTLSESIFVVSAANRASLVSKYSWCGQPCDLERAEHGRGAKGVWGQEAKWPLC